MPRRVDLDELLDNPLVLVIGGKEITITSLPVELAIRLGKASEDSSGTGALEGLVEMLEPLGMTAEEIGKMDTRKALGAAALIVGHFTSLPTQLMALTQAATAGNDESPSTGLPPSPPISPQLGEDQQ